MEQDIEVVLVVLREVKFFLLIFQETDDLQIIDDATATATDGQEVKFLPQFIAI